MWTLLVRWHGVSFSIFLFRRNGAVSPSLFLLFFCQYFLFYSHRWVRLLVFITAFFGSTLLSNHITLFCQNSWYWVIMFLFYYILQVRYDIYYLSCWNSIICLLYLPVLYNAVQKFSKWFIYNWIKNFKACCASFLSDYIPPSTL